MSAILDWCTSFCSFLLSLSLAASSLSLGGGFSSSLSLWTLLLGLSLAAASLGLWSDDWLLNHVDSSAGADTSILAAAGAVDLSTRTNGDLLDWSDLDDLGSGDLGVSTGADEAILAATGAVDLSARPDLAFGLSSLSLNELLL